MSHGAKAGVIQVRCTCGSESKVAFSSFGHPVPCSACRSTYVPVWGIDPRTKQAVPIPFQHATNVPRGFWIPTGVYELPCPCGQNLYARPQHVGKRVQCPVCATWMKLEQSKDPQTLQTRIRVVKSRLNQLPAVPPSSAAPQAAPDAAATVQLILCSCGESLRIDPTVSGNQAQCPACGARMRLELKQGMQGSGFVVNPGSNERGIDEELSLDDFT
ncbi:MAG TPA: hypothetical protein VNM14_10425 [Planctomycetota bacterium]|nr:hypothetical protein [Planctomycetota bacterium]